MEGAFIEIGFWWWAAGNLWIALGLRAREEELPWGQVMGAYPFGKEKPHTTLTCIQSRGTCRPLQTCQAMEWAGGSAQQMNLGMPWDSTNDLFFTYPWKPPHTVAMPRYFCDLSRTALAAYQGAELLEQGKNYFVVVWEGAVTQAALQSSRERSRGWVNPAAQASFNDAQPLFHAPVTTSLPSFHSAVSIWKLSSKAKLLPQTCEFWSVWVRNST